MMMVALSAMPSMTAGSICDMKTDVLVDVSKFDLFNLIQMKFPSETLSPATVAYMIDESVPSDKILFTITGPYTVKAFMSSGIMNIEDSSGTSGASRVNNSWFSALLVGATAACATASPQNTHTCLLASSCAALGLIPSVRGECLPPHVEVKFPVGKYEMMNDPIIDGNVSLIECPAGLIPMGTSCIIPGSQSLESGVEGISYENYQSYGMKCLGYLYKCKTNNNCCSGKCLTRKDGRRVCGSVPTTPPSVAPTSVAPTSTTTRSATQAPPTPAPSTPPTVDGKIYAKSFGKWSPTHINECPKEIHDKYQVIGPDGKVYPT